MKIIKRRKKEETSKKFRCQQCDCVFIAEKSEYKYEYDPREGDSWYGSQCPECQSFCRIYN